ncbi:hypothetical protein [Pandoraea sp. XY-2]|uniref:hypothetical protein n=1 Tax=Pandoraea sp. XY-2 TaxID=2518599 RepID=UPI0013EE6B82|nr:hypothetical protein [Pandoraea sp. XY-2]
MTFSSGDLVGFSLFLMSGAAHSQAVGRLAAHDTVLTQQATGNTGGRIVERAGNYREEISARRAQAWPARGREHGIALAVREEGPKPGRRLKS